MSEPGVEGLKTAVEGLRRDLESLLDTQREQGGDFETRIRVLEDEKLRHEDLVPILRQVADAWRLGQLQRKEADESAARLNRYLALLGAALGIIGTVIGIFHGK